MRRDHFKEEHILFRDAVKRFAAEEIAPHNDHWEEQGICDRSMYTAAANFGFLGPQVDEKYGGVGINDFRYNQILMEEFEFAGVGSAGSGIAMHNDIVIPYFIEFCTEEQKQRWLPGLCSGKLVGAIAMTDPSVGSDLGNLRTTATVDGDQYIVVAAGGNAQLGFKYGNNIIAFKLAE